MLFLFVYQAALLTNLDKLSLRKNHLISLRLQANKTTLNLKKQTTSIDDAVFEVRLEILKVFGIALLVTVLLSIYLARTIARPLHKLAAAANLVRHGLSRQYSIPDLGLRSDEIGRLSAALKDMTEALWERMDAIEQFAADVAHEIKNPLNAISINLQLLNEDLQNSNIEKDSKMSRSVRLLQNEVSRLDSILSDFLRFAKRHELHLEECDINEVIDSVLDFISPEAMQNSIRILKSY